MTSKQLEKRESIIQEIVSTEKNYVTKLGLISTHFLNPLSDNANSATPFISRAELRSIFSELVVVQGFNAVLLVALEKAVENASSVSSARIGGVFTKLGSFLRWYHSYVSNYDNAFQTLKRLKAKSTGFRSFIASAESKPELGLTDLESLLILPIQRIPQYNLLMADLAKVTTDSHPDYVDTVAALALVNQIGSYINEKKREAENIAKVIEIGKTLIGFPNLAVPYRRFVRKANMFCLPDSAPSMAVVLFAFNDVLLVTQEGEPGIFTQLQFAYWERVALVVQSDPSLPSSANIAPETPLGFTLKLKEFLYSLVANTPDEKAEWVNLVKESVEATKRKAAEKEVAVSLKRKLLSLNQAPLGSSGSIQMRSLGVLAKGMLKEEKSTDHTAPINISPRLQAPRHAASVSMLPSTRSPAISSMGHSALAASTGSGKTRAQEARLKSKKARESIETEVKAQLLKEGIPDGSIDEFLSTHRVEASYIVPISLTTKINPAGVSALLALSHFAFFIFLKSKLHQSGFLYDIKEVSSKDHPDFTIRMNDGMAHECRSQYCDDIIYQLRRTYLLTYFGIPDSHAWALTTDDWRKPSIAFDDSNSISFGNFVRSYRAACAYLEVPLREDFIWDLTHNPTNSLPYTEDDPYSYYELNLSNLEELTNNDMKTLMMALRFNPYFTSLVIRDVVLSRDAFSAICDMLKYNHTLKRIVLVNNGLGKDHIAMLSEAFNTAPACNLRKLEVLQIRENSIETIAFLNKYLDASRKSIAFTTIDLSNTNVGSKAVTSFFVNLRKSTHIYHTLVTLKLAGCKMDTEGSAAAAAFLATPCAIRNLDVSNTGIKLVQVLEAMTRGCIYLASLNISQNKWDKKIEPLLVKFLTGTDSIREVRVCATGISAESLSHMIEAASTNVYVTQLSLFADENSFGALGASQIAKSLKGMIGIVELSLADNDFGDEGLSSIFQTFASGTGGLQRLVLDANFRLKTSKGRSTMMKHLIKMTTSKSCKLTHLSIAGMSAPTKYRLSTSGTSKTSATQLKTDIIPFLDCLPRIRLSELNISGHRVGPRGILALGRALQECTHLKKLWWDENGTTIESFTSIVHAVQSNTKLLHFPAPLIDLSAFITQGDPVLNAKILRKVEHLAAHIAANNMRKSEHHKHHHHHRSSFSFSDKGSDKGSDVSSKSPMTARSKRLSDKNSRKRKDRESKDTFMKDIKDLSITSSVSSGAGAPKVTSLKIKLNTSTASSPTVKPKNGPKSARGDMETSKLAKSSGKIKNRGTSADAAQGVASSPLAPEASSHKETPSPVSAPTSTKRHLRQPSNKESETAETLDVLHLPRERRASISNMSASTAAMIAGVSPRVRNSPRPMASSSEAVTEMTSTEDVPSMLIDDSALNTEETLSSKMEDEDVTADVEGSESSLEEVLELDEHYNDDSDDDYTDVRTEEDSSSTTESRGEDDDDDDNEETDEFDEDEPIRSHYRHDDDDDSDDSDEDSLRRSPRNSSDLEDLLLQSSKSPRSPRNSSDLEDLLQASKSPVRVRYRKAVQPTDSFKKLKSAALELPPDLGLTDSEDQSVEALAVYDNEDDSEESTPYHLDASQIQKAVALEYGAQSDSNSDSDTDYASTATSETDDGIDRSAFDLPPTVPSSTTGTKLSPRSPRPNANQSSPRTGSSPHSRPSSPGLISPSSPRPDSALSSPQRQEASPVPSDAAARYASVVSVGEFEHAPVLPSSALSPRTIADALPTPTQLSPRVITEESPRKSPISSPGTPHKKRVSVGISVGEPEPTPSTSTSTENTSPSSSAGQSPDEARSHPSPSAPKTGHKKRRKKR